MEREFPDPITLYITITVILSVRYHTLRMVYQLDITTDLMLLARETPVCSQESAMCANTQNIVVVYGNVLSRVVTFPIKFHHIWKT